MKLALLEAQKAYKIDEIPVGAVVISDGKIIGKGYNQREQLKDPTAHAEILALSAAANTLNDWRLNDCTIYVTKEPCAMCAGAIINSRIKMVVFGCYDKEMGCCGSLYQFCGDSHLKNSTGVEGGIMEKECLSIIYDFFQIRRKSRNGHRIFNIDSYFRIYSYLQRYKSLFIHSLQP